MFFQRFLKAGYSALGSAHTTREETTFILETTILIVGYLFF